MPIPLTPLLLPLDRPAVLTIQGLAPGELYVVHVRDRRGAGPSSEYERSADDRGSIQIEGTYAARGEHLLDLYPSPAVERLARLAFYVAPAEMHARRPYRCDFHIHTTYSDGRNPVAEMLIRGRELGLDVAVITDHNRYAPSIEALEERDRLELNLITMPGEEVSGPNWHLLSIDAEAGIYDWAVQTYQLDSKEAREAWEQGAGREYETMRTAVEVIHAHNGRAYLAHPYWAVSRGFHLPSGWYDRALGDGFLDGVELLGDVVYRNNYRSLARYLDYRAAGAEIPIIGCSDTHGAVHTYGTYWTLAFAADPSPQGVLDAIRDGWSVACTTLGERDPDRRSGAMQAYGTFELVDCAYFLEEQFYPRHDALCAREADLAYRVWRGERLPAGAMAACKAEMELLYDRCWGAQ